MVHARVGRISRLTGFPTLMSTDAVAAAAAAVASTAERVVFAAASVEIVAVAEECNVAAAVAGIINMVVAG